MEMKEILAAVYEMFSLQCFNTDDSIENIFVKMKADCTIKAIFTNKLRTSLLQLESNLEFRTAKDPYC